MKNCVFPGCVFNAESNGYCIRHQGYANTPTVKIQKVVAKRSDAMKDMMKELKKLYSRFLSRPENRKCKIISPDCTKVATCVNHKRRRGKNLFNEKYFEPSCGPCNAYIESHPKWAYENGHLISVHKNQENQI